MTKEEIIESIEVTKTYSGKEVRHLVHSCPERPCKTSPTQLRKGDVYRHNQMKGRPVVIIKVTKDKVWGISLSTTQDSMNMCESNSRFFRGQYFCYGLHSAPIDYALENFLGVFDNNKSLNKAIKQLALNLNFLI